MMLWLNLKLKKFFFSLPSIKKVLHRYCLTLVKHLTTLPLNSCKNLGCYVEGKSNGWFRWYPPKTSHCINIKKDESFERALLVASPRLSRPLPLPLILKHINGMHKVSSLQCIRYATLYIVMPGWHSRLECWLSGVLTNAL